MKNPPLPRFSHTILLALVLSIVGGRLHADPLKDGFSSPTHEHRPETWFHLIGGNIDKAGLTEDLEAISAAGIQGIQLFHGKGAAWPGVNPQVKMLSPTWDSMIAHVADESARLGLRFSMQNCPGWATSGGPWITQDNTMRHLIWSRKDLQGGETISIRLDRPEPSTDESWRDYREVAVLAFPTPADDSGECLRPVKILSNRNEAAWADVLEGKEKAEIMIEPGKDRVWLEIVFDQTTTLRSIEFPPIAKLTKGRVQDPDAQIIIQVADGEGWRNLVSHNVPRGSWQDTDFPYVMAVPDASAKSYRLVFNNNQPLVMSSLRFSSAARSQDWRGQAAYALRSRERIDPPAQAREAWVRSADVIDLTENMDVNGHLTWIAPSGRWTVVRFGHVNTGAKNKPAPGEGTGFECDKLSSSGAEQHFAGYIGRLTQADGPAGGGRMHGILTDSWECRTQTWTPDMESEFTARLGYPLRRWLPALAGWVIDDHQTSERFLRDWRANISDMMVDNYFGKLADLARARGLKVSFETAMGDVITGDILKYFSRADIPMCEVWQSKTTNLESKPIAPTVSAAHIYGKKRVAAETFTRFGVSWDENPTDLKPTADRAFCHGVTHLVFHTYTHNPVNGVPGSAFGKNIGTPFLRGQTWWKHMPYFTDYLARCGYMLERGKPVADILWYLGDDLDHKPRQDQPFPEGYRFDYLNADVLLNRLSVRDGALTIPEGTSWRVLWLPREQCARLTPATLGKLKELLEDGATVIGEAPRMNPSLSESMEADRKFGNLVKEIWGDNPKQTGDRKIGKGRLLWGDELATNLVKAGIAQDVAGAPSGTWIHRRDGETDIYFIATGKAEAWNANLHFRARGTPEFWDPLTGKTSRVAAFKKDPSGTTIAMQLPTAGSVFVVFRPGVSASAFEQITMNGQPWQLDTREKQFVVWTDGEYQFKRKEGSLVSHKVIGTQSLALKSGWTLSFPPGWDAPCILDLDELKPWSKLEDKATRHFSGSATYRTSVRLEAPKEDEQVLLDLGRVAHIAELRINGRKAAVLWTAPFSANITEHLKAGENIIEIEVTNTWSNRLNYDSALPEAERKTWTFPERESNSKVKLAGLEGPVHLRVGKRLDLSETSKK